MGGGNSTPPAPAPTPLMPVMNEAAIQRSQKKAAAASMERSGRLSTVLSQIGTTDKLGS